MKLLLLPALAAAAAAGKKPATVSDATSSGKPLVLPASFETTGVTAAPGSPNVVVLMVDDLGYGDVSFSAGAGSNDGLDTAKATPTLSSLASEGVVLTSFYAQPSCTPSRASFLTGKYTTSIGLQDSVIHATEPRGLSLDEDILPQRLSAAGYQTMGVGKWHVGFHQPQYSPTQRGFEEYFGILTGGGGHFNHQSTASFTMRGPYKETQVDFSGSNLWHNGAAVDDEDKLVKGRHTTDIYTNVAVAQLSAAHAASSTTPFFLFLSYQAVHAPMEVPPHYVDGTIDNGCDAVSLYDSDAYGDKRKTLCGMLSQLDDSAKTVVNHLKSDAMGNAWDNTVLVFLSDNGGVLAHGSSNVPFAGEKGTFSEGGVRVPAFVAGGFMAKSLSAAQLLPYASNSLVHISDLHATILSLASSPFTSNAAATTTTTTTTAASSATSNLAAASSSSTSPTLDGVSQWAFWTSGAETTVQGKAFMPRTEILHNMNSEAFGSGGALRMGDFKLIVQPKVSESEVYTYAQHVLQDGDFDLSELSMVVGKKLLKNDGTVKIFNVAKNPGELELEDGGCDSADLESCANLAGNEDFKQVEIALMDKWKVHRDAMDAGSAVPSTVAFQDDGPLCNPALFGGSWAAWRDEEGIPYATYATVAQSTHFDSSGGGVSSQLDGSGHENKEKGDSDGTGEKTWKHETKVKEVKLAASEPQGSSSARLSSSSSSSPFALVAAGSVLGAVGALLAVVVAQRVRSDGTAASVYAPVATSENL